MSKWSLSKGLKPLLFHFSLPLMPANFPLATFLQSCQQLNGLWMGGVNPIVPFLTSPTSIQPATLVRSRSGMDGSCWWPLLVTAFLNLSGLKALDVGEASSVVWMLLGCSDNGQSKGTFINYVMLEGSIIIMFILFSTGLLSMRKWVECMSMLLI